MIEKLNRLLLRPQEVFESLGLSRSKGYALIASGNIPSIKIGKAIRVPIEELHTWLNKQKVVEGDK